jgi:hypothetical protein
MPAIIIKSGTTAIAGATVKGSFSYFSGSTADLGPTSSTGFFQGVDAPVGGYAVYQIGGPSGVTARVATNTSSLNSILISAGGTGTTVDQNITWATNTNSVLVNSGATPVTYVTGQTALGGIIAYILKPGDPGYDADVQHGLVVTSANTATSQAWSVIGSFCATNLVGATGSTIGTGAANTAIIVSACTGTTAASRCVAVRDGGYSDWYLPSTGELDAINNTLTSGYGFTANLYYWTSSEESASQAGATLWNGPNNGGWVITKRASGSISFYAVRAVRSF